MKKIIILTLGILLLNAYNLKIFNIPNNSTIQIDNKKYENKNTLLLNLKSGTHKIKITNPNFKPIKNSFEIEKNNKKIIILNKSKGYILQPYKTYFKNIVIKYKNKLYKCDEKNIVCIAKVDDKNYNRKYKSSTNIYQIDDKQKHDDFYIKVKAPYFYSESTSTDALKDEIINFEPIPNWSKIGFFILRFSYINLNEFKEKNNKNLTVKDYQDLKNNTYAWNFMINYKKNLPYINIFFYTDVSFIIGGNSSDSSDEETELYGPTFSIGIGKSFFNESLDITLGIKKLSLTYKDDYTKRKFTYDKTQPFIQMRYGIFNITVTKNVYSIGLGYTGKF